MTDQTKGPGAASTGAKGYQDSVERQSRSSESAGPGPAHVLGLPATLARLKSLSHWVVWKYEVVKGRTTKVPYQPNGKKAKINDPATWSSYEAATAAAKNFDGVGFCLLNSGFAAFDVDDCRDPSTGALHPWAKTLVERCGSYAEITPSGTGIRIIGTAEGEKAHRKLPAADGVTCEVYRRAERYITISGNVIADLPLARIDDQIDNVILELDQNRKKKDEGNLSPSDPSRTGKKKLPQELRIMLSLSGEKPAEYQSRSELLWAFLCKAVRAGLSNEDITVACVDASYAGCSICQHVAENSDVTYLERQITKAREKTPTFKRDAGGKVISKSQENIVAALDILGIRLRYDVFADRMTVGGLDGHDLLDDAAVERLWLLIDEQFKFMPTIDFFWTVAKDLARRNSFHPVREYLDGLSWDGVERINKWIIAYGGAADTEYVQAVGSLILIAAVRRARQPGCKFDEMLILESNQGTDKSKALETLAVKEEWFTDDLPLGADSKRMIEHLKGRWIIEAAELSGMRKAEVGQLKGFLSRRIDRARMSYDRAMTELKRQCVVFGSTNDKEYLKDQTGNRRYWPVAVTAFDIEGLRGVVDQLWAEASFREARGDSIRLEKELWPKAQEQQAERTIKEPWIEVFDGVLKNMEGKLLAHDAWTIVGVLPAQRQQEHNRRLGDAMRALGWERKKIRVSSSATPLNGYARGDGKLRQIVVTTSSENGRAYAEYKSDEPICDDDGSARGVLPTLF